jgi:hypothetical protein
VFPQLIDQCVERFTPFARTAGDRVNAFEERLMSRLDSIYRALTEDDEAFDHVVIPFKATGAGDYPRLLTVPRGRTYFLESLTASGDANGVLELFDRPDHLPLTVSEASGRFAQSLTAGIPVTVGGQQIMFGEGVDVYVRAGTPVRGYLQFRRETVESRHPRPSVPGAAVLRPDGRGYRTETERHATMNGHAQVPVTGL